MCVGSNMGSHCATCFTAQPIEHSSSSANLTPNNENVVDLAPSLIAPKSSSNSTTASNHAAHIATSDKLHQLQPASSLGHINEEKEENIHYKPAQIHVPQGQNIMHTLGVNVNPFQRIEASQTMTSTTNTNTPWSPSSKPTAPATNTSDSADDTEQIMMNDYDTKAFKHMLGKMKRNSSKLHEYAKADSFDTENKCDTSAKDLYDVRKSTMTETVTAETTPDESSDDDDEIPGPPPKLALFNNSNRPPLLLHDNYTNKRCSESSRNGLSINIERTEDTHTHSRLSGTKTSFTLDVIDRLKIPNPVSLSQSVSAFDELGKKLNHMPTFQRALTTSITSLTSMHSQSVHLSFEKSLKLRESAPSFHSVHSLRSLRTTPTTTNDGSVNGLFTHILCGHGHYTPPVITHQPSLDMPTAGRVSLTPSLPSISAKDVLDNDQFNVRFSSQKAKNNVNPLDLVQKRVLFVSLMQLHRSFLNGIPPFVLEHAVFVFGIKKIWLFPQTEDEIEESKESYIEHFRSSWSKEFIQMIANKDGKGHVLWIEPCHPSKAHLVWETISNKLSTIVDLSVSEEETKRKKKEIELQLLQLQQKQKRAHSAIANAISEEKEDNEHSLANMSSTLVTIDNEIVSRFPSDRTDSIPPDVPTMSYADTPMSSMFSKMNTNHSSLQRIDDDEEEKKQMGIADTLLQIHNSKENLDKVGPFPTVFMTADDDEGLHTDSDYDDEHDTNDAPASINISVTKQTDTKQKDITPPVTEEESVPPPPTMPMKSRPTTLKIAVEDVSKQGPIKLDPNAYLPYYEKLKLQDRFWRNRYEPVRKQQSDQIKLALAESAKLIKSPKQLPHHNESINLALVPVKSLFNVEGEEVLKQLRCISSPNDIKLKPIKELFYQSNPTLIPMEYFEWNKYVEYHMDPTHKYFDILQYCERFYAPTTDLTPSHSSRSRSHNSNNNHSSSKGKVPPQLFAAPINNNSSVAQMEMLEDDDEEEEVDDDDPLKNAGFEMIDNVSSNQISANLSRSDSHAIKEVNVDESGMVYMFDYDDDDDDDEYCDADETTPFHHLILQKPTIPFQSSITSMQSLKSDSALPFNGRLRGGGSESSVQLFD